MTTWHIKKTAEDRYHVTGSLIDENVNDVQLMGMLASKGLPESRIHDIFGFLGAKEIGHEQTVSFNGLATRFPTSTES